MKRRDPPLLDLWNHPEPGKAVQLMTLECIGDVHTAVITESSVLYSLIPHKRLWRHILTEPGQVLYVYNDRQLVATQVYHGKTNPYFYPSGATITAIITSHGEKAAFALLCEFRALSAPSETCSVKVHI